MLNNRMSAFFDIDEWAADAAANVDVMVGFRLHGNVIALHQGIPAIFFTYDSRIRELSSLFAIPSIEIEDYLPINLEKLLEKADFTKVQHIYRQNFAEISSLPDGEQAQPRTAEASGSASDKPQSVPNLVQVPHNIHEAVSWFRSEIDFMTGEVEVLRNRAWNLKPACAALRKHRQQRWLLNE